MISKIIRLGVIGLGNIGQQHIKEINNKVCDYHLTAVYSRSPVKLENNDVQHFNDYKPILTTTKLQYILLPITLLRCMISSLHKIIFGRPLSIEIKEELNE